MAPLSPSVAPSSAQIGRGGGDRRLGHLPLQQAGVQVRKPARGRRTQLVAEDHPELLVGPQRLGAVALCRQRLHQTGVARLAVGEDANQLARRALGPGGIAEPEPEVGRQLQRPDAELLDSPPLLLQPIRLEPRQELPVQNRRGAVEGGAGAGRVLGHQALRSAEGLARALQVELAAGGQHEPQAVASLDRRRLQGAAEAGEQGGEGG
jgi:hypothetical protein